MGRRSGTVPEWKIAHTVTPSPHHPQGRKGVEESATVAASTANSNAVVDALANPRVTHMEIPIRPDRLWEVLRETRVAGSRRHWRVGR